MRQPLSPDMLPEIPKPCRNASLAGLLHGVHILTHRRMGVLFREQGLDEATVSTGRILHYLEVHEANKQNIFQKDLEEEFRVTRSTISCALRLMEERGYITRESVPEDARLKRVKITPRGMEARANILSVFERMDRTVDECLTDEEQQELRRLLLKLDDHLRG